MFDSSKNDSNNWETKYDNLFQPKPKPASKPIAISIPSSLPQTNDIWIAKRMPWRIAYAQSCFDACNNRIIIFGGFKDGTIQIFDTDKQQYLNQFNIDIPNYDSIHITPEFHSVIPIFQTSQSSDPDNKHRMIECIVSIQGWKPSHFAILTQSGYNEQWYWNTSFKAPRVGCYTRAVNIDNNIHWIDSGNNYWEFQPETLTIVTRPRFPFDLSFGGFDVTQSGDYIFVLNCSHHIVAYLNIQSSDMQWRRGKCNIPFPKMSQFGCVSINDGMALIIGGNIDKSAKKSSDIYIFDGRVLTDFDGIDNNHCFVKSKTSLPQPLYGVNCCVAGNECHIIGGTDKSGNLVNTHYIINLWDILPTNLYNRHRPFVSLFVDYWFRKLDLKCKYGMPIELTNIIHCCLS